MTAHTRGTGPILVGYDGSSDAELALGWAVDTARRERRTLEVLVVEDLDRARFAAFDPSRIAAHELENRAARVLKEAELADSRVCIRSAHDVVPVILQEADHASQVILGSTGHRRLSGALVGSVSQAVVRQAPCPVVVVRAAADADARRVVVGMDGSGHSRAAVEFACQRAELTGETVTAVHAWRLGDLPVDQRGNVPSTVGTEIGDRERLLAESVAGVLAAYPDVRLDQVVVPVPAGEALVDASRHASLIVTGSHGRGLARGLVLGSVSQRVLSAAHCPVAIVRPQEP